MMNRQIRIPAAFLRGGTSNALVFHARDLPADCSRWEALFCAAMGSPDPNGRQLDGMGGGISSLSKICVVGPPTRDDADLDYTFFQVGIDRAEADTSGNCGNMSSAMGPFAIDEGLVRADGAEAVVRIHNTNTSRIIVARFPVEGGRAAVEGDFRLPGVSGTGAPVRLEFLDPGGAGTGHLLPTGRPVNRLKVEGIGQIDVSLVDAANPCCLARAGDLGLTGTESPEELERAPELAALFEAIRRAAGRAAGYVPVPAGVPKVGIVAPPAAYTSLSGARIEARDMDFSVRMISVGRPHRAVPLTAAMCLAVAAGIEGTLVREAMPQPPGEDVRIGQPSGVTPVGARVVRTDGGWRAEHAVVYRTARRLMDGWVYASKGAVARASQSGSSHSTEAATRA